MKTATDRARRAAALCFAAAAIAGCGGPSDPPQPSDPRPDLLLVVLDTLRADGVSAYGEVEGTTPELDALAAEGLVYTHAYAPSPWTLPSHASLFTGAAAEQHGVGLRGRMALPDAQATLAERLAEAGYETAGFSENPLISEPFGMQQGFAHFAALTVEQRIAEFRGLANERFDIVAAVREWADSERDGPFFAFVNLFDAHDPYTLRDTNAFVPPGRSAADVRSVQHRGRGQCRALPPADDLAIWRALYLDGVAQADAKLGRILALLRARASRRQGAPLITVVTADHGEHLGEHGLLGHEFSVRNVALHVPLVVHGRVGVAPARIDAPVTLADVPRALLAWAGVPGADAGAAALPERAAPRGSPARDLVAVYTDESLEAPSDVAGAKVAEDHHDARRTACRPEDRVFGDTASLTRFPFKLIWFEDHPPQLYDLSWDPRERSDQAALQPERVAALRAALEQYLAAPGMRDDRAPSLDPDAAEALRELGYAD